jgi:hypothetical protein
MAKLRHRDEIDVAHLIMDASPDIGITDEKMEAEAPFMSYTITANLQDGGRAVGSDWRAT